MDELTFSLKAIKPALNNIKQNNIVFHSLKENSGIQFQSNVESSQLCFPFSEYKILEFCEATKSYTSALYEKVFSTVVKCLCG